MSLKTCPEWRNELSSNSITCSKCGYSFIINDPTLFEDGIIILILSTSIGSYISQYYPLFGDLAQIGQPFSPARLNVAPLHIILFSLLGLVALLIIKYFDGFHNK